MKIHQVTIDDIPKKVIPQTVLDSNGLPTDGSFPTNGIQVAQVSLGIKPVLITSKSFLDYKAILYKGYTKNEYLRDLSKDVLQNYIKNLYYVEKGNSIIIFRRNTVKDAFIFSILGNVFEDKPEKYHIFHTLYGYILGYSNDDIMAWFMSGAITKYIETYHKELMKNKKKNDGWGYQEYLNNKDYYDKLEPIKKISVTFPVEFEKIWKESMKELRRLRKIPISEEFKKSIKKVTIG